ncbi:uncharacterized protein PFL1_03103 [Pseudozyma flocculosa PF-1]|uniref:Uncharacterized protein n=2 Tax=Pseudozyma flocculosa TaxID=84751 RepID=A0A5C3F1V7_9BASI|nr:uncharacterized protein PFL1_03103 [Pseudozyma flocculosa PF-1]EPQ29348.1 hypothetical protein PFL1_03103 [Pseudozyma flocculosa PF-1]SPO37866.1 uncharacterized protein PSFLO_03343 [Pseudozyma flocculosa]
MSREAQKHANERAYAAVFSRTKAAAEANHSEFFRQISSRITANQGTDPTSDTSPGYAKQKAVVAAKLETFTEQYIGALGLATDIDKFLSPTGPKLEQDRAFLRTLLEFLARPEDASASLSIETVRGRMVEVVRQLEERLSRTVPRAVRRDLTRYLEGDLREDAGLLDPIPRMETSVEDILHLMQYGIFGGGFVFKSPRDRLQMLTLLATLCSTGARPGEIVVSDGYEASNDALQYKDLRFRLQKVSNSNPTIHLDLTIRNEKGHRGDPTAYRIQSIYSAPWIPLALDAATLLLILAVQDGALVDIDNLGAVSRIPASAFEPSGFVDLPIKATMRETLVLRQIDHKPGARGYTVDPVAGLRYSSVACDLRHVAIAAEMAGFVFYDIRRMVFNALHRPDVPEADAQFAMGHRPGTDTMRKHYLTKRTGVDVVGLVVRGEQVPMAEFRQPRGFGRSMYPELTAEEEAQLEDDPSLAPLNARIAELSVDPRLELPPAADEPAAGPLGLDLEVQLAERLKERKSLADKVRYRRKRLRHEARLAKGAAMQEAERRRRLAVGPATLEEITDDEEVASTQDAVLEQAAPGPVEQPAAASAPATGSVTDGAQGVEDTDDNPSLDTWAALRSDGSDPRASSLATAFASISAATSGKHEAPCDVTAIFATTDAHAAIAERSDPLLNASGTKTAAWSEICEGCGQPPPGLDRRNQWSHVEGCVRSLIESEAASTIAGIVAGEGCAVSECSHVFAASYEHEGAATAAHEHIRAHIDSKLRKNARLACNVVDGADSRCSFAVSNGKESLLASDAERALFLAHLEAAHGLSMADATFCHQHDVWLIGTVAIEAHFAQDVAQRLEHLDSTDISGHHCPICLIDAYLRPSKRDKYFATTHLVEEHVAVHHVVNVREEVRTCELCDTLHAAIDFPQHLIEDHGIALCGRGDDGKPRSFYDEPDKLFAKTDGMRENFLLFVGSGHEVETGSSALRRSWGKIRNRSAVQAIAASSSSRAQRQTRAGLDDEARAEQRRAKRAEERVREEEDPSLREERLERGKAERARRRAREEDDPVLREQRLEKERQRWKERDDEVVERRRVQDRERRERKTEEEKEVQREKDRARYPARKEALITQQKAKRAARNDEERAEDARKAKARRIAPTAESKAAKAAYDKARKAARSPEEKAEALRKRREYRARTNTPEKKAKHAREEREKRAAKKAGPAVASSSRKTASKDDEAKKAGPAVASSSRKTASKDDEADYEEEEEEDDDDDDDD